MMRGYRYFLTLKGTVSQTIFAEHLRPTLGAAKWFLQFLKPSILEGNKNFLPSKNIKSKIRSTKTIMQNVK